MLNEEELRDAALLVFANKQDQPGAKGAGDISEALRLGELRDRNWSIVACSAVDGRGVDEGMDWLVVRPSWLYIIWKMPLITVMAANGQFRIIEEVHYCANSPYPKRAMRCIQQIEISQRSQWGSLNTDARYSECHLIQGRLSGYLLP